MITTAKWRTERSKSVKGCGMGKALDAYNKDVKAVSTLSSYAQFEDAHAAADAIRTACTKALRKLDKKSKRYASTKAIIDGAAAEANTYIQLWQREYGRRTVAVRDQIAGAMTEINKTDQKIDKIIAMLKNHRKAVDDSGARLKDGGASLSPSDRKKHFQVLVKAQTAAEGLAEASDSLIVALRKEPIVAHVRLRGAKGLCEDRGVGGDYLKQLNTSFKQNIAAFSAVEAKAKEKVGLQIQKLVADSQTALNLTNQFQSTEESQVKSVNAIRTSLEQLIMKVEKEVINKEPGTNMLRLKPSSVVADLKGSPKMIEDQVVIIRQKVARIEESVPKITSFWRKRIAKVPREIAQGESIGPVITEVEDRLEKFAQKCGSWAEDGRGVIQHCDTLLAKFEDA